MDVLQSRNGGIEVVRFGRVPNESKYDSVRPFSLVRVVSIIHEVPEDGLTSWRMYSRPIPREAPTTTNDGIVDWIGVAKRSAVNH